MDSFSANSRAIGWLYVIAQFTLIGVCFWGARTSFSSYGNEQVWQGLLALTLLLVGIALGVWALWAMGSTTFSVLPNPAPKGSLCERGPYRWLCHPMYTAVLLVCIGLCVVQPSLWRFMACLALLGVLIGKLRFEESLLQKRFTQYPEFRANRYRLVPGLW